MRQWRAMGAVVVATSIAVVGAACRPAQGDLPETDQPAADESVPALTRVVNVSAHPVRLSAFTDFIRITGQVEASEDVTLSAEESGTVARFLVAKGGRVRVGQVIARLDNTVLAAQAGEMRASAALAAERFERQRRLWEEERIGSEIAFIEAKAQAEVQAARLRTLEARLASLEIVSRSNGIFDEQFVEVGEWAPLGTPVARVVSVDRVKVTGGVPERFAAFIQRGDRGRITFDILPDRVVEARISFVGSTVNERSRTFPIEIEIDNPDGMVKPQMVANVQLERISLEDVIVVPQEVVLRTENGYEVFVVEERNGASYAAARAVRLGPSYGDRVVIEEGLAVGDLLIAAGSQLVDDGNRVRIVNGEGA